MTKPWLVKHTPKKGGDVPQPEQVEKLRNFITDFKKQKKKAALLYGPAGTCKTCSVHAIANELGLELIEINASDSRNKDSINEKIGNALKQQSLFFSGKIVLVDEVDGVSGTKDRGGIPTLVSLIAKSAFPIVMTCNDPFDKKFSGLRTKSIMIEFPALNHVAVFEVLKDICLQESIEYDEPSLKSLARRSGGDLRAAINDLEIVSCLTKKVDKNSIESFGERDRLEAIQTALVKILKSTDPAIAVRALDHANVKLDESFLWIDHNIAKEYTKPADLARAYDAMSRAAVFKGRIRRWQYWRFLVYVNALMTAGVAVAKDEKYPGMASYERTTRLLKIWQANMKYAKRKAIAQKLAEKTHCSSKRALQILPYVKETVKNDPDYAKNLALELELDDDELKWLEK